MGNAVPVSVHGFSVTAGMVALLNVIIVTAIGGAIKAWPKLRELGNSRRKDELEALRERIDELEKRLDAQQAYTDRAEERAHDAEMTLVKERAISESKLSSAVTALQLVIEALREKDPNHPAIRQAQKLIELAASNDSGFGRFIGQLSAGAIPKPGAGE